jgi:hypothetical protein
VAEAAPVVPDFTEFSRQSWAIGEVSVVQAMWISAMSEVGPYTPPHLVPVEVLDAMGYDPVIYHGERAVLSPVLDAELYYVRHPSEELARRHTAWLRPLLPDLLRAIARAFTYGAAPVVLDWREGLPGAPPVHYGAVHDLWPGDVAVTLRADEVVGVRYGGALYGPGRAFVPVWDRSYGELMGEGSRRRAYRAWFSGAMVDLWHARYLERSVDVPRIGFAPDGTVKVGGQDVPAIRLLTNALMSLRNGSACVLPSTRTDGEPAWKIEPLDLPERDEVFQRALSYYDARKLQACLVPPGAALEDVSTGAGARVADALLKDFVQSIADFLAVELTRIVAVVHRVNYGEDAVLPEVIANDVPAARRRLLLEVLRATVSATQRLPDGRAYTLGELVHPEILDQLGVRARPVQEAAHAPAAPEATAEIVGAPSGRPNDTTGGRQDRRDDARTDEARDGERPDARGGDLARIGPVMLELLARVTERVAAGHLSPEVAAGAVMLAYPELDAGSVERVLRCAALAGPGATQLARAADLDAAEGRGAAGAFGVLTRILRLQEERPPAQVVVNVPEREVNVSTTVEPARVNVPIEIDARAAPVNIEAGAVNVEVQAPPAPPPPVVNVDVDARREPTSQHIAIKRDAQGRIASADVIPE